MRLLAGRSRWLQPAPHRLQRRRIPDPLDFGRPRRMARSARPAPCRDRRGARRSPPISPLPSGATSPLPIRDRCRRWCSSTASPRRSSPASDAARCRCCCRSTPPPISRRGRTAAASAPAALALPGGFPSRRPLRCRAGRLRRGVFARARRWRRHAVSEPLPRPVEVQITGSLLTYDIADPAGGKGEPVKSLAGAISGYAPVHPRRLCALRLHPLRRALCGVDPVPRLGAARAPARLPRSLSGRRTLPESAAHRGRPARAATLRHSRHGGATGRSERSADFTYRPPGDIITGTGYHRQSRPRGFQRLFADPLSAGSARLRPFAKAPLRRQSRMGPTAAIPGATISARPAAFSVGQCANGYGHQGEDIRPGACPCPHRGAAAIPGSSRSSRCATAS